MPSQARPLHHNESNFKGSDQLLRVCCASQVFADVNENTPCVFVLSPGADPMALLLKYASSMGMETGLEVVSLGRGQGPRAEAIVEVG